MAIKHLHVQVSTWCVVHCRIARPITIIDRLTAPVTEARHAHLAMATNDWCVSVCLFVCLSVCLSVCMQVYICMQGRIFSSPCTMYVWRRVVVLCQALCHEEARKGADPYICIVRRLNPRASPTPSNHSHTSSAVLMDGWVAVCWPEESRTLQLRQGLYLCIVCMLFLLLQRRCGARDGHLCRCSSPRQAQVGLSSVFGLRLGVRPDCICNHFLAQLATHNVFHNGAAGTNRPGCHPLASVVVICTQNLQQPAPANLPSEALQRAAQRACCIW